MTPRPLDVGLACQNIVRQDGQGRAMLELTRALAARGHRVTVYAHRLGEELRNAVTFRHIPEAPGPQAIDDLVFCARATHAIRRAGHDVVCALGPSAIPSERFVFYVQFSHRGWRRTWRPGSRPGLYHAVHARLVEWMETLCARRADRVLVTTSRLGGEVAPWEDDRIAVVPNGVDVDEFHPFEDTDRDAARARLGLPRDAFVVGFLGGYATPRKGLDPLMEAIARGDEHLLVAGAGRGLTERVAALGLEGRVHTPGFFEPTEIYACSDLVCVPSLYEPFSLVALEAASCGIPVVVSSRAGAAAHLEGAAVTVHHPEDPASLREAIDAVRTTPGLAEDLTQRGRAAAERLAWNRVMPEAAVLLETVAAGSAEREGVA